MNYELFQWNPVSEKECQEHDKQVESKSGKKKYMNAMMPRRLSFSDTRRVDLALMRDLPAHLPFKKENPTRIQLQI